MKSFHEVKDFQPMILGDLKAQGFRVKKMQSGMGYVVLDLYVRDPKHGSLWIELKTIDSWGQKTGPSALQELEVEAELDAGGIAGCIIGVRDGREVLAVYHQRGSTHVTRKDVIACRPFRGQFDCRALIDRYVAKVEGERVRKPAAKSKSGVETFS